MAYFLMSSPKIFLSLWLIYSVNYDFMLFLKGHKLEEWTKRGVIHHKTQLEMTFIKIFSLNFSGLFTSC